MNNFQKHTNMIFPEKYKVASVKTFIDVLHGRMNVKTSVNDNFSMKFQIYFVHKKKNVNFRIFFSFYLKLGKILLQF